MQVSRAPRDQVKNRHEKSNSKGSATASSEVVRRECMRRWLGFQTEA